jgi:F0F1-type ATP synthase assembly protein I
MPIMIGNGKDLGRYLALGQVGIEMVVPICIGAALDYFFGWGPWGVIVGTVLGFSGGMLHLIQMVQQLDKTAAKDEKARSDSDDQTA